MCDSQIIAGARGPSVRKRPGGVSSISIRLESLQYVPATGSMATVAASMITTSAAQPLDNIQYDNRARIDCLSGLRLSVVASPWAAFITRLGTSGFRLTCRSEAPCGWGTAATLPCLNASGLIRICILASTASADHTCCHRGPRPKSARLGVRTSRARN
jgi:hypothetical protein